MRPGLSWAVGLGAAGLIGGPAAPAQTQPYELTLLATLGGSQSFAAGVNDAGQVVGSSYTADGDLHAFIWADGVMRDLGTLGGSTSSATGVNATGQVAGWALDAGLRTHAVVWNGGIASDLGDLGGGQSYAYALNDAGQVVGESWTGSAWHAFLWQDGEMTDLGTLGGRDSKANAINEAGAVAGFSDVADLFNRHAFAWQGGAMLDLGTLGGAESFAYGINSSRRIVGLADDEQGRRHAFSWEQGEMTDWGLLPDDRISWALAINDAGQAVGYSYRNDDPHLTVDLRAVLYAAGVPIDLNCLIRAIGDGVLEEARAISQAGSIAGIARRRRGESSRARAFLLTPSPEALDIGEAVPGRAGELNRITVANATPGARVFVAFGADSACTSVPGIPQATVAIRKPWLAGHAIADAGGEAVLDVAVPDAVRGRAVLWQAVEIATERVSDVAAVVFD